LEGGGVRAAWAEQIETSTRYRERCRKLQGGQVIALLLHRAVREAKGLLLAADGVANAAIAERLGVSRSTVLAWRKD